MIDSRELRIGNIVKCLVHLPVGYNHPVLSYAEVLEIKEGSVYTDEGTNKYKNIGPILLTEDILIRSGGIKSENNTIVFTDTDTSTPDVIILVEDNKFYLGNKDGEKFSIQIESLHQFQNMYFTIQGKEVKINL